MTPRAQGRFLLFLLAAIVAAAVYVFQKPILGEMNALYLLPRQDTLTELYLNDSLSLPKTPIEAGSFIQFSFTIHNVEGQQMAYPYIVYVVTPEGTTTIDSSSIDLPNGSSTVITESYAFNHAYPSALFVVDLMQLGQEIHFLLPSRE